jgi:Domain of Unknown Function (DUF1080)
VTVSRRSFIRSASLAAADTVSCAICGAKREPDRIETLFNGKNLDSWIQVQNSEYWFSSSDILNSNTLARMLRDRSSAVSGLVATRMDSDCRSAISAESLAGLDAKAATSALAHCLTRILTGASLYDNAAFRNVHLRSETRGLLAHRPQGGALVRLNRMLLEDAFPEMLARSSPVGWMIKDRSMASTGVGRGVIYTVRDYRRFRLMFTMRHISGSPDHQGCVLIFCMRPAADQVPLDALGGIQFQVPNGGHWDYRPGRNDAGGEEFTTINKVKFDPHQWSRVEILADSTLGTARMAVAQPPDSMAVEVLDFSDRSAGRTGPVAWQMHNAGLFDEYKDVVIDPDPAHFYLISI